MHIDEIHVCVCIYHVKVTTITAHLQELSIQILKVLIQNYKTDQLKLLLIGRKV